MLRFEVVLCLVAKPKAKNGLHFERAVRVGFLFKTERVLESALVDR